MNFREWLNEQREMKRGTHPDEIDPIQQGEQFKVYHGFYNFADAINIAMHGVSGKMRVGRTYSYESENNPKGMFVTLDRDTAGKEFAGGPDKAVVMEFIADEKDLEPPTWPGGSYTVQGQMAPYFYEDPRGARVGRAAKKKEDEEAARKSQFPAISQSHRPGLAQTLFGSELQALFMGDLNPEHITQFWVQAKQQGQDYRGYNDPWTAMTREQFLQQYGQDFKPKDNLADRYADSRMLEPADDWNWQKAAQNFSQRFRQDNPITTEKEFYDDFIGSLTFGGVLPYLKGRMLEQRFGQYIWPKQLPGLHRWIQQMYRQYGEPGGRQA